MRYFHLFEEAVDSSWISDLDFENGNVIMTLLSGRRYRIRGIPEDTFEDWTISDSPGGFWHAYIRGIYSTIRVA